MMGYVITPHARFEMERRGIDAGTVEHVVKNPGQRLPAREGREVLQSQINLEGKIYIVRIIVETERQPMEVVTVYKTSKKLKYWRQDS